MARDRRGIYLADGFGWYRQVRTAPEIMPQLVDSIQRSIVSIPTAKGQPLRHCTKDLLDPPAKPSNTQLNLF